MRTRRHASARLVPLVSSSAALALAIGCASQGPPTRPTDRVSGADVGSSLSPIRPAHMGSVGEPGSVAAALERLGAPGKAYHQHVTTLSSPFFEGRAPGSRGLDHAGEYLIQYLDVAGLDPAFDGPQGPTWRQTFMVPGETRVVAAEASWSASALERQWTPEVDFNPLAFGGNGVAEGEPVFVGYAIENGPHAYSSFEDDTDLTGKIAIVLRFEPMDRRGRSMWSETGEGWSSAAGLVGKLQAVVDRGAEGIILVNPPAADDPRARELMTARNSRMMGGRLPIPLIQATTEAVDELVQAGDARGRTLMELRRLADSGDEKVLALPRATMRIEAETARDEIETANIGGVLPGSGDLAREWVVIGAHYDHIGYGHFGSRTPSLAGTVHPGADDNASGTAGVLLLAESLADRARETEHPRRSILFLLFSAEEMGLLGSRAFIEEPTADLENIQAMINMDMIGRLRETLQVNGVGTGEGLREIVMQEARETGVNIRESDSGEVPSDQATFVREGIPVLGFFTGTHPEYHTAYDQAWTVNHEGALRVLDLVGEITWELATEPVKLAFVEIESPGTRMGRVGRAQVRLGIAPGNYADTRPGVLVGSVSSGTAAEAAGLRTGDRIIRWGGEELPDVVALMQRLADHKPGDVVRLLVERDGEEIDVDVELTAPQRRN